MAPEVLAQPSAPPRPPRAGVSSAPALAPTASGAKPATGAALAAAGAITGVGAFASAVAAKALAEALTRYLVLELGPRGIRINCVAPSGVDTDALRSVYGEKTDDILLLKSPTSAPTIQP